jgi:hypothetical protein
MSRLSADVLKAALPATTDYARALPDMLPCKRGGWVDGGPCPFHTAIRRGYCRVNLREKTA